TSRRLLQSRCFSIADAKPAVRHCGKEFVPRPKILADGCCATKIRGNSRARTVGSPVSLGVFQHSKSDEFSSARPEFLERIVRNDPQHISSEADSVRLEGRVLGPLTFTFAGPYDLRPGGSRMKSVTSAALLAILLTIVLLVAVAPLAA